MRSLSEKYLLKKTGDQDLQVFFFRAVILFVYKDLVGGLWRIFKNCFGGHSGRCCLKIAFAALKIAWFDGILPRDLLPATRSVA